MQSAQVTVTPELPTEVHLPFSPEVTYVALLFALIVLPRVLMRWKIPTAVTSLVLGGVVSLTVGWFRDDATVELLATLGISTLFLFAGLDVDLGELAAKRRVLGQHLAINVTVLPVVAWVVHDYVGPYFGGFGWRAAILLALALVTPSAGFILDSLAGLPLTDRQRDWVRSKTVSTELVSLLVLFVVLQSATLVQLALGLSALAALLFTLPLMFRVFATAIAPFAPKSEFAFLLMMTLVAAFITRKLGAYYLVGAFVVGMVAQRFRERLPSIGSEQTLHAVEVFAAFFVPFYFFSVGLHLRREHLSLEALAIGLICLVVVSPSRIVQVAVHRRLALGESFGTGARVGIPLTPTLVFTLVIAELLRDSFGLSPALFGGLLVYALGNTVVPVILLRTPPPRYDRPVVFHPPRWPAPMPDGGSGLFWAPRMPTPIPDEPETTKKREAPVTPAGSS